MPDDAIAIIGDVHGEAKALGRALDMYLGTRHVVLLGDYVNRGPEPNKVLDLVGDAVNDGATALLGNHEQVLLRYVAGGDLAPLARVGGLSTIKSYIGDWAGDPREAFMRNLPERHLTLLNGLLPFYETSEVFASHCGISPYRPLVRDVAEVALASHPELFTAAAADLPKVVVCGHYVQRNQTAYSSDKVICVDTGCGTIAGAPLTVLEWPERSERQFEVA